VQGPFDRSTIAQIASNDFSWVFPDQATLHPARPHPGSGQYQVPLLLSASTAPLGAHEFK